MTEDERETYRTEVAERCVGSLAWWRRQVRDVIGHDHFAIQCHGPIIISVAKDRDSEKLNESLSPNRGFNVCVKSDLDVLRDGLEMLARPEPSASAPQNAIVEYQGRPGQRSQPSLAVQLPFLPRKGESLIVDGREYTVIHVFHEVGGMPIIRVRW
jgi:hypothetical protein